MADLKARIAKRCAKHFVDGDFINLGIGLPTMVADYLPEDVIITCHSENGFAGIDILADQDTLDVDVINSGGQYVTYPDNMKIARYVARYEAEVDTEGNLYRIG